MNLAEFNLWKEHYLNAFPQTLTWLSTQVADPIATLATWYRTLKPYPLVVCTTVTDRIIDGKIEPVDAFRKDQTALIIRAYAGRIMDDERKRRERATEQHRHQAQPSSGEQFPAAQLYLRASKLWRQYRDEGLPDEIIRKRVNVELDEYLDEFTETECEITRN